MDFWVGVPTLSHTKLVQSKTFIPENIRHNQDPNLAPDYTLQTKQKVSAITKDVAVDVLWYGWATESEFMKSIATTNAVVAYIDHGALLQPQQGLPWAFGLCFGAVCNAPKALLYLVQPSKSKIWDILYDGYQPKAKVVFLASCGSLRTSLTNGSSRTDRR